MYFEKVFSSYCQNSIIQFPRLILQILFNFLGQFTQPQHFLKNNQSCFRSMYFFSIPLNSLTQICQSTSFHTQVKIFQAVYTIQFLHKCSILPTLLIDFYQIYTFLINFIIRFLHTCSNYSTLIVFFHMLQFDFCLSYE